MRLIDADALIKAFAWARCEDCPDGLLGVRCAACQWDDAISMIEDAPTAQSVPLDKLCEFLAGIYGTPCQLGEIECYPQCEPDREGCCLGMRSNDVTCWKSYLTKWMEGAIH